MSSAAGSVHRNFLARSRFGSLDGLRGLAILAVVWHHAQSHLGSTLASRGHLGVDLFFVVSGFLIVTLLLRERARTGSISLRRFYVRRGLRIFPLYYLALTGYFAIAWWRGGDLQQQVVADLPYAAAYIANWVSLDSLLVITWSLAAEEQFYLFWPGVERFAPRAATLLLMAALATCVAVQLLAAHTSWPEHVPQFLAGASFTPILAGVALARTLHSRAGFDLVHRVLATRAAAPLALAALIGVALHPWPSMHGLPRVAFALAGVALVGACVVREDHGLQRLLTLRPLVRIGVVSYGIYLLHLVPNLALMFARNRLPVLADPIRFAAMLAVGWALAELSFVLLERPLLRLKERWR